MTLPPLHVEHAKTGKPPPPPRRFHLVREFDEGVFVVAVGARMPSGRVVMEWQTDPGCIAVFNDEDEVRRIHGHGRRTRFVWDDPMEAKP